MDSRSSFSRSLPPPPANPERPPPVRLPGEEELWLKTTDGLRIEALAYLPTTAARIAVLCHPHPLYGGTMNNAMVVVVAKRLLEKSDRQLGFLRLNYRGVERSEGSYGGGNDETLDVLSAFAEVRRRIPEAKLSLVAYSFGTGVGYRAAVEDGGIENMSLIAPSPRVLCEGIGQYRGPVQIVAAENDPFCAPEETADLAKRLGASLIVVAGADHYFVRFRREVASSVVSFIAPELSP
jgi:alpha/beta superfamily hydrolase